MSFKKGALDYLVLQILQKGVFYVKEYCKKYTYSKHIDFRSLENLKNDLFLGKNQNPKKMEIIIRILKHFEMH